MKNLKILCFAILAFSALLGGSCDFFKPHVSVLWTDRADIAASVETFNAEQEDDIIEIIYKPVPAKTLLTEEHKPDLIISSKLTPLFAQKQFKDLNSLFASKALNKELFYDKLLQLGRFQEAQFLLPISFNLPIWIFKEELQTGEKQNFSLDLEQVKKLSQAFNKSEHNHFTRMGFSPRWDKETLYLFTMLKDVMFKETADNGISFDEKKLKAAMAFIRDWTTEVNGNLADEQRFIDKYLQNPGYKLIESDKILFFTTDLTSFFNIPEEKRKHLDFRWVSADNKIPVYQDIVFAGIPKLSRHQHAAQAFLTWLLNLETQKKLMEKNRIKRLRIFGITQGLSSLIKINETEIPRFYPELFGSIPDSGYLRFHALPSINWNSIKTEILLPWLEEQTVSSQTERNLREEFKLWQVRNP